MELRNCLNLIFISSAILGSASGASAQLAAVRTAALPVAIAQRTPASTPLPIARDSGVRAARARDAGVAPVIAAGGGALTFEQQVALANSQRAAYAQQLQLQAQQNQQITIQQQPSTDPLMAAAPFLVTMFNNNKKDNNNGEIRMTREELEQARESGSVSQANYERIINGQVGRTRNGKKIDVTEYSKPEEISQDTASHLKSEPDPNACKGISDTQVNGVPMPCEAIKRSLKLMNKCPGSFPNEKFMVINDYSRLHNGSFKSWLIPLSKNPDGQLVVGQGAQAFNVSNGKMRGSNLFCSKDKLNQSPAGFAMTNFGYHNGPKQFKCSGPDCNLPGVPSGLSPKIGIVGIDPDLNATTLNRGVLFHVGAERYAKNPGQSWGCSVLEPKAITEYWNKVGGNNGGALSYNYIGEDSASKVCDQDKSAARAADKRDKDEGLSCEQIRRAVAKQNGTQKLKSAQNQKEANQSRAIASVNGAKTTDKIQ